MTTLLVINGNTTQAITDRVAATARAIASPGTTIKAVTANTGPRVISTRAENLLGAHNVLSLAARHHAGCAAVVVAVASDTGLRAVREALPIPVTGITEAALLTACALGDGFGYLAIGRRGAGMYRDVIAGYGLATRMAAFKAIDLPPDAFLTPSDAAEPILAAICELAEAGADTVIIGGAAFAGLGRQLQDRSPIPIGCASRRDAGGAGIAEAQIRRLRGAATPGADRRRSRYCRAVQAQGMISSRQSERAR